MKSREDCKTIEELIEVSRHEHDLVRKDEKSLEFNVQVSMRMDGHQAVAMRDMLQVVELEGHKDGPRNRQALLEKIFNAGMEEVYCDFKKVIKEKLKDGGKKEDGLEVKAFVVNDKKSAEKLLEVLEGINDDGKIKSEIINRLKDRLKED